MQTFQGDSTSLRGVIRRLLWAGVFIPDLRKNDAHTCAVTDFLRFRRTGAPGISEACEILSEA